ncbi:WhiB family transcriptional regulator [Streptomyces cinereoruber]|uniref:WhiB family transcriptional regulator n=1 Tax=Streptomyces cinereoruber TaxID=67260 RepID=UPI00362FBB44
MTTEISLAITSAADTPRDVRWEELASCSTVDPELFFPDNTRESAEAVEVCMGCPVRQQCLEWAMERGENHFGVIGGLTAKERRALGRGKGPGRKAGEAAAICQEARADILRWREEEMPMEQIARRLGVAAKTVRVALEKFALESKLGQQDMGAAA